MGKPRQQLKGVAIIGQGPNRTAWRAANAKAESVVHAEELLAGDACAGYADTLARLAGVDACTILACERLNLNRAWHGKDGKGDAFDMYEARSRATSFLIGSKSTRAVLLGHAVAEAFGFRDAELLARHLFCGKDFLIFPHPSGISRWWNDPRNEKRAATVLKRFLTS